ncbi:DoxX family protein [Maribacter halichondriae]|uniref:DoxX family protein n=1 Tax=Maribacter halichondriae TaxID=2980554 RepID=UPI002359A5DE|nr:DoxX family protein [Maribacter sp. Hal144]
MKARKITYWIATGILTAIMLFSIQMYFLNYETVQGFFEALDYPKYLVYPLAIAKILGLVAIWGNFSKWLKEWAYAGFFFDFVLAFTAHWVAKDGGHILPIVAIVVLMISYFLGKTVRP